MLRLRQTIELLAAAQRALAERIERQARPERGWTLENWGRRVMLDVERARATRDAAAVEYRAELLAVRRALAGRANIAAALGRAT